MKTLTLLGWTQPVNRETDISAEHVKKKKRAKEKTILIDSRTRCCKLLIRGTRAPTANHQSQSGLKLSGDVGGEKRTTES